MTTRSGHESQSSATDSDHSPPDGAPYIVMEFLDGASLGTILRRDKRVALGTLARIVGEVLAALEAAHGKSVIARLVERTARPHRGRQPTPASAP